MIPTEISDEISGLKYNILASTGTVFFYFFASAKIVGSKKADGSTDIAIIFKFLDNCFALVCLFCKNNWFYPLLFNNSGD